MNPLNFAQTCFEERICDCIECLENVGFSVDHILCFLPEAALGILDATQTLSLYQAITCMQANNPTYLLRVIDVDAMATKLDMDSIQVTNGLRAVVPILLDDLIKQCEAFSYMNKGNDLEKT